MSDRTTARAVGALFLVATAAGVSSRVFLRSLVADDYLVRASAEENLVATGALMILVMAIAVVAISIVIYPVLRRFHERLALGYIVARTVESMTYVVTTVGALALLTLGRGSPPRGLPTRRAIRSWATRSCRAAIGRMPCSAWLRSASALCCSTTRSSERASYLGGCPGGA